MNTPNFKDDDQNPWIMFVIGIVIFTVGTVVGAGFMGWVLYVRGP